MTDSVHPTIDELADLQEGLLDDAAADRLRDHLTQCVSCAADLRQLLEVERLLSTTGTEPVEVPLDVVARIDDALAAEAAGIPPTVSSMAAARTQHGTARRRRPWLQIMAGAAAVLVFAAFGIEGWQSMNSGSDGDDAGSAADAGGGDALVEGQQDAPQAESGKSSDQFSYSLGARAEVTPDSLPTFARKLAKASRSEVDTARPATSGQCASALSKAGPGTTSALVRWADRKAVVVVDPATTTASVFGCGTSSPLLYSTAY